MPYCAFSHTPLTIWKVLAGLCAKWKIENGAYKVEYVLALRYLARHFELPDSTANYLLDQLIVEGLIKVKEDDGKFFVFVPMVK